MKDVGTKLEPQVFDLALAKETTAHGLYLMVLPDRANRNDIEAFRDILQESNINALLIMESVVKEIRHLDKHVLEGVRHSINDALGLSWAHDEAANSGDMTPQRVLAALEKKPRLLAGVRQLLRDKYGTPPTDLKLSPETTAEQEALLAKLFEGGR